MANNVISEWIERVRSVIGNQYAAKLDRLIVAAWAIVESDRKAIEELRAVGITDQDESLTNELAAALLDIPRIS